MCEIVHVRLVTRHSRESVDSRLAFKTGHVLASCGDIQDLWFSKSIRTHGYNNSLTLQVDFKNMNNYKLCEKFTNNQIL